MDKDKKDFTLFESKFRSRYSSSEKELFVSFLRDYCKNLGLEYEEQEFKNKILSGKNFIVGKIKEDTTVVFVKYASDYKSLLKRPFALNDMDYNAQTSVINRFSTMTLGIIFSIVSVFIVVKGNGLDGFVKNISVVGGLVLFYIAMKITIGFKDKTGINSTVDLFMACDLLSECNKNVCYVFLDDNSLSNYALNYFIENLSFNSRKALFILNTLGSGKEEGLVDVDLTTFGDSLRIFTNTKYDLLDIGKVTWHNSIGQEDFDTSRFQYQKRKNKDFLGRNV